jgi:L-erythro-3,5-diaminohexanoate dehydrogenase
VVPVERERDALSAAGLADAVALADARDPVALASAVAAAGGPGRRDRRLRRRPGLRARRDPRHADLGTVVFFSMATSFAAAALGAEGLAADVTLMIGNGYAAGHADFALEVLRNSQGARGLFEARLAAHA